MKKLVLLSLTVLFLLFLAACGNAVHDEAKDTAENDTTKEIFKIGAIPDQNASDLNRSLSQLAEHLHRNRLQAEYVPSVIMPLHL